MLVAGTDEDAIIRVLSGHSNRQRQVIKDTYKTSFGRVCIDTALCQSPLSLLSHKGRGGGGGGSGGGVSGRGRRREVIGLIIIRGS